MVSVGLLFLLFCVFVFCFCLLFVVVVFFTALKGLRRKGRIGRGMKRGRGGRKTVRDRDRPIDEQAQTD